MNAGDAAQTRLLPLRVKEDENVVCVDGRNVRRGVIAEASIRRHEVGPEKELEQVLAQVVRHCHTL